MRMDAGLQMKHWFARRGTRQWHLSAPKTKLYRSKKLECYCDTVNKMHI
jgi:hypothetical protein